MESTNVTDLQLALQLFPGYAEADVAIFNEFISPEAQPEAGFVVDFLGSRIRTTFLWEAGRKLDGLRMGVPVPADFHAEAIEWIGLLKAVRSASNRYVSMELGAGFGPWTVAGATAARRRGINDVRLYAVEGDPGHFGFLREHFIDNGLNPDRHLLLEAAVGAVAGVAHWPVASNPSEAWGGRPIQELDTNIAARSQETREIEMVSLHDLLIKETSWDLIHIDVQGDEVAICASCISELSARVRWMIVGTHSRKIDGDLLDLMWRAEWILEHEKPAQFVFAQGLAALEPMTTVDGTQVWRNPRLVPEGDRLSSFSQEITTSIAEINAAAGATFRLLIDAKNTGTQTWRGGGQAMTVAASYRWFDSAGKILPIEGRRTQLSRATVQPGESDQIDLEVDAPLVAGSYSLAVSLVQEGVNWFVDRGAKPLTLRVLVAGL